MAFEYRWTVVCLCVWLVGIDPIRGQPQVSDSAQEQQVGDSTSSEDGETDYSYLRLEDLVRQEIQTYFRIMQNDLNAETAYGARSVMQPRHLSRRGDRFRRNNDFQSGATSFSPPFGRRPPYQNNRFSGMSNDYGPYSSYDYPPSTNQLQYINGGGYDGWPNQMMWNGGSGGVGGGIPGYGFNGQTTAGPGGRVGILPARQELYGLTGNRGPMQMSDSVSPAGNYVIQIPNRRGGRRNNPNTGSQTTTYLPGSQSVSAGNGGGPAISAVEGSSSNLELPVRVGGGGSQAMQISTPQAGSQSITMDLPMSGELSTQLEVPARRNGAQSSSQSYIVSGDGSTVDMPSEIFSSGGRIDLPAMSGVSVGSGGSASTIELPVGGSGMRTGQTRVSLPSSGGSGGSISTVSLPMNVASSRGPFGMLRTGSGRGGLTGGSIQTQPITLSTSESEPNYQIDVRDVDQPTYAAAAPESLDLINEGVDLIPEQNTVLNEPAEEIQSIGQEIPVSQNMQEISPSSFGVTKPTFGGGSMYNLVGRASSNANEGDLTSASLGGVENGVKGSRGMFPSFRWGRSGKPAAAIEGGNAVTEVQSSAGEQMGARSVELPEVQTNSKTLVEPITETVKVDQPESAITTTMNNAASPKRRTMRRPGSYYIIHHPVDGDDSQELPFADLISETRAQRGKYGAQPAEEMTSNAKMIGGNMVSQTQAPEFGKFASGLSRVSRSEGGLPMMEENSFSSGGDGSITSSVGTAGNGRTGRQRAYKVVVVNGDHDILRNLKLPQPGSQFVNSMTSEEE